MIDKNRLQAKCSTWNIPLTGAQLDLLDRYAELLVSYNEKVNLTAITSPQAGGRRHRCGVPGHCGKNLQV